MSEVIDYSVFSQVDIRIGKILSASLPEWSEKLIELKVNFGEEIGDRTILAGLRQWYSPEDLQGKQSVFVVNLAPRKMGPSVSEGMILAAGGDDNQPPTVLLWENLAEPGDLLH